MARADEYMDVRKEARSPSAVCRGVGRRTRRTSTPVWLPRQMTRKLRQLCQLCQEQKGAEGSGVRNTVLIAGARCARWEQLVPQDVISAECRSGRMGRTSSAIGAQLKGHPVRPIPSRERSSPSGYVSLPSPCPPPGGHPRAPGASLHRDSAPASHTCRAGA
jgi:hypothetical protein